MNERTVNVYLTRQLCEYLGADAHDVVIESVDNVGGIFVHSAEQLDEEGSGVWVDASGTERFGSDEPFLESDTATEFLFRVAKGKELQKQAKKLTKKKSKEIAQRAKKKMSKKAVPEALVTVVTGGGAARSAAAPEVSLGEVAAVLADSEVIPKEAQQAILADLAAQRPVSLIKTKKSKRK